jgi:hypothetical protein
MSETVFVGWKWKQPGCRSAYDEHHVNVWASMLRRSFKGEARIICITDDPKGVQCETFPLWSDHATVPNPNGLDLPSCFRRLKIFSEPQTRAMGIAKGSKVVSMDLDVVLLGDVTDFFAHATNEFMGWRRPGTPQHPPGYNGSIFMFRTGTLDHVWDTFDPVRSPIKARRIKHYGSDQGWMSYCLSATAPGWGKLDGIYSFSSDICAKPWPPNARIVMFNGKAKPWHPLVQIHHPWIVRFWRSGPALPCNDFVSRSRPRVPRGLRR